MARPHKGLRQQFNVRLPVDLIAEVNAARGPVPLPDWAERAFRLALKPHSQVIDPELLQEVHTCAWRPLRTEIKGSVKLKIQGCECGMERTT